MGGKVCWFNSISSPQKKPVEETRKNHLINFKLKAKIIESMQRLLLDHKLCFFFAFKVK